MHTINVYLPDISIIMPVIQAIFALVAGGAVISLLERYTPFLGS